MSRRSTRDPREQQANSGFTLLEVLVALAVVAVMLGAVGQVVAVASKGTLALERRVALTETVHLIATDVLHQKTFTTQDISGETSGYRWQLHAMPLSAAPASPFVPYQVVLRVTSPWGAAMSLETIRLRRKPQ